jgi:hypothetical protein
MLLFVAGCEWSNCGVGTQCEFTCIDIRTDVHNCGGCGNDCALLAHVLENSVSCAGGRCQYDCKPYFLDCDGFPGCETVSDGHNCAVCGNACELTHECTGAACVCPIGESECDGTCVPGGCSP